MSETGSVNDLRRIKRVADQSASAHARLRDSYAATATALDTLVLSASAWVAALALIDPALALHLTPGSMSPTFWIGLLGIAVFIATLTQQRLDFKGKSDAHRQAFEAQAEIKQAANEAEQHPGDESRRAAVQAKIALAVGVGVNIPEARFVRLKAIHLRKVELSRLLDKRPFAWLPLIRVQLWWRDTFGHRSTTSPPPNESS